MIKNSLASLETPTEVAKQTALTQLTEPFSNSEAAQFLNSNRVTLGNEKLPVLQLPSDFPKTPSTPYEADYQTFCLPTALVQPLHSGSTEVRSLLVAAFSALLHRYTQQPTLHLGWNADGRNSDNLQELSVELHPELNGRELSQQIATTLKTSAQPHALLQPLQPLPIVVSCFDEVAGVEAAKQLMLEFRQQHYDSPADLELHLAILQEDGVTAVLEYNTHLFRPDTIKRLAEHWQTLLDGMVSQLDEPIAQLPLLTPTERQQLLVKWSSPNVTYPLVAVHQHIETHAAARPEAIALKFQDQQLSYAELNQRANQLAHYLLQIGVAAGDRVAVCTQPSLESVISLLAIFKAGGTYVPLDSTHPLERLTAILEDTQANVLLTQSTLRSNLPKNSSHILCLDQNWDRVDFYPNHNPDTEINLDETAYIIYTSGTTGKPKGVMASYRNLINYILATQAQFGFNPEDVMPAVARFTFSIAMFELLSPLAAGGTLVLLEREHVLDFARMAKTLEQLTMLHTVPSLMQKLLTYIRENNLDIEKYQGVKYVFTGGDIVAPDLLETMRNVFPNARVYVLYGCSEVSSLCANYAVPTDATVTESRVGKPFNNVCIRVCDPNQNLVPIGVPGEIYVGGAGVTKGYLHRPDLTQEKFVTIDGQQFYRTGDLGRFHADGNLEFLGRADFQVKLRGIRIELGDIEAALRQAPGVREGVVTACELGGRDEKSLVAYVVLDQNQNSTIVEIRRFLQAKLPDYMVPAGFVVLPAMPLNHNQKVDRRALPLPTAENLAGLETIVPACNQSEQRLIEIWEALLGVQPIGIQNDFFELGGNSLLAVQMFAEIEKQLGKRLPLSTLVSAPTIEQLAKVLQPNPTLQSLVLLKAGQGKLPVFLIHDGNGETLLYRSLAYALDPDVPVYGIQPHRSDRCPILHTRISSVVDYYIEQIRQVQPQGPYFLGGMCVGGMLAFEMALQLQKQGESVEMLAIIDAADAEAAPRTGYAAAQRLNRFSKVFSGNDPLKPQEQLLSVLNQVSKKATNLIAYEFQKRFESDRDHLRLKLLRNFLDKGLPVPRALQGIPVRKVLLWAQREYVVQGRFEGEILLFRATQKSSIFDGTTIDDTPYVELYSDPLLGWSKRAEEVQAYDVPGGHSSMLQEPNVQVIAKVVQACIDTAIANRQQTV